MSSSNKKPERVKLASVKRGIYNTQFPNWKDMERDDMLGKLSDEHIRSSVVAGTELPDELFYQYNASSYYIPNYEVLPLFYMKWREEKVADSLSFLNNPHLEERWRQFKKYLPLGQHRIVHIPQVKDFHFLNYHVRYQKPEVRNSWKNEMAKVQK